MKKSKFIDEQIAFALKQAERKTKVADYQKDGDNRGEVLPLEAEIWRAVALRS